MLPSDSILEALMQQQKFKTTLSELKMLLQPMVDVLPLPEEDPKRVKVEKELWNAMKKKDVQGVYCLAGWALKYAADGGPLALALYRTASQNGDYISRYCYATLLYRGAKGMPPDRPKGRKMLESLARPPSKSLFKPFPLALSTLAGIYALDDHNFEGARDLYLQAAKAGVTEAYLPLSRMYLQGELPRDEALARKYLEMAVRAEDTLDSEKSQAMAHFLLANMDMMKQDSDETKFKSAFQHYQKAASKGLPEAQYNLGNVYFKGLGVGRNEALAVEYWKMSAMQGFGLAQLSLGAYYFQNEEEGSPKKHEWDSSKRDLMQAQKWFTLASRRPGELGSEGERLKAQVDEAIKRGGGGVRNGPCVIM
ncbi:hypothetical protein BGZ99_006817 [Dissophora globulifera]|uniref:HCP-like protein n=1 Tax=Dissophora globulifera TaxID=979702 RepID=A0A9P6RFN3_9FUNG|nr:hypothetical protein BGZ99_006817 [Dissophora globulifera]